MRRISTILTALAVFTVVAALPAGAVPPLHERFPSADLTITDHCAFDVFAHVTADKGKVTTFFDQDGNIVRQHLSGTLKVEVTNLDTGTTEELNISGPGTFILEEDGSVTLNAQGGWLLFFIANRPGELLYTHGPFEATIGPDGFVLVDPAPNETDVCALLS